MRIRFGNSIPSIGKSCFLAANATVVGAVTLGENSSVWFSAVLRADVEPITVAPGPTSRTALSCMPTQSILSLSAMA